MAVGDFLDISQRALRLSRRDATVAAQVTLAKEAVNEGYAQVLADSDDWDFLEREGSTTLAVGTDTRTLALLETDLGVAAADDIEEIIDMTDDTNDRVLQPLSWLALENIVSTTGGVTTQGMTEFWAISQDRVIRFSPRPSVAFTLRVRYRLRPGLMTTDGALPVIPAPHAAVVLEHYAAWKLLLQDSGGEALNEADRHLAIHERALAILRKRHATSRMPIMGLVEPAAFYDLPDTSHGFYGDF